MCIRDRYYVDGLPEPDRISSFSGTPFCENGVAYVGVIPIKMCIRDRMTTVAYAAVTQSGLSFDRQLWLRPEIIYGLREVTGAIHTAVSYTHLDVYKRQLFILLIKEKWNTCGLF